MSKIELRLIRIDAELHMCLSKLVELQLTLDKIKYERINVKKLLQGGETK